MHERQRMMRIGDHPRAAVPDQVALLQIVELPSAVLLRHQASLQTIGEPRDDALQMRASCLSR